MYSTYEILLMFFIYAFLGWCTEVSYAALNTRKFINRGFLNGCVCPIYGFGVTCVILCLSPIADNLILLFLGSVFLTSALEFVTGFLLEKVFNNKWWDYSDVPYNIHGYVCLKFSIIWGLACVLVIRIVQPIIDRFIDLIPKAVGVIGIIACTALLLTDLILTILTVNQFNKKLKAIDELSGRMKSVSDNIGEYLSGNVVKAAEKAEPIRDEILENKDNIHEKINEKKKELEELREKYAQLLEERRARFDRLIKSFPQMKSFDYQDALEALKNKVHNIDKK